jgi:hypothetical protein
MLPQNQTDLMIVYLSSKAEFNEDVISNRIDDKILDGFHKRLGHSVGASEVASWRNSISSIRTNQLRKIIQNSS